MNNPSSRNIWDCVVESIRTVLEETGEEPDKVEPHHALGRDLGIASMHVIHLMVTIEDRLDRPLNFHQLACKEGTTTGQDLTAGDLHRFVCESLRVPVD
ncbi:MAG TPA: hypothetical protein VHR66_11070 [Gemmataceae bacterium]|jgi:acyl carrier protein|nr:hypothetical protein [Gemmataceae bacterium]